MFFTINLIKKDSNSKANYTKDNTNNCKLIKNTIFLNFWIYKFFKKLISRLKSKEEHQHTTRKNRKINKKE